MSETEEALWAAYHHYKSLEKNGAEYAIKIRKGLEKAIPILRNAEKLSQILSGCQEI